MKPNVLYGYVRDIVLLYAWIEIKLNVGSVNTFHEPSKVNSQSINTLQFLFQVISECNKDLWKEIHQA